MHSEFLNMPCNIASSISIATGGTNVSRLSPMLNGVVASTYDDVKWGVNLLSASSSGGNQTITPIQGDHFWVICTSFIAELLGYPYASLHDMLGHKWQQEDGNTFYSFMEEMDHLFYGATNFLMFVIVLIVIAPNPTLSVVGFIFFGLQGVWGVDCPHCHGNAPSCTFAMDKKCPLITIVAANAMVIAGTATAVGLSLTHLIRPRFLRAFMSASLDVIQSHVRRPAPGTAFVINIDTKMKDILQAISSGQYTMELAFLRLGELSDDLDPSKDTDKPKIARLERNIKLLGEAKDVSAFKTSTTHESDGGGVFSFIWAKLSVFVSNKEMDSRVTIYGQKSGEDSSSTTKHAFTAKAVLLSSMEECAETMNLFILFVVSLGISSTQIVCDFYEHVFFDTIRMRGRPWQFAVQLMLVMFRRIEDSGGTLNLGNIFNETSLNLVMEEAERITKALYPKLVFFRIGGGTPRDDSSSLTPLVTGKPWNNKYSSKSKVCCPVFNGAASEHLAKHLHPDGTCKYNHACDHWVSSKGKNGRCLGEKGTPNHGRANCDHPDMCDNAVEK